MKKIFLSITLMIFSTFLFSQKKIELFDLVKTLAEKEGIDGGDWAVGRPATYPVKWKEDRVIMSEDTSINFYRQGFADILINKMSVVPASKPINVMLRGPRSSYMAYNILIAYKNSSRVKPSIDSLFGKNNYTFKLLKSCTTTPNFGFDYYEVSIPKRNKLFIKIVWRSNNTGMWIISLDCNDDWSKNSLKTSCPGK